MRKFTRVLCLCLMLALVFSLGMPAAFAEGTELEPEAVEPTPTPAPEVPDPTPTLAPEVPAASSEPVKEDQPAARVANNFAAPAGKYEFCIHNWKTISKIEATCTENGKLVQECSKCGAAQTVIDLTAPLKGHDHSILVETKREATCTLVGWGVYKCVRCDHTLEKTIPKKDHVFNAKNVIPGFGLIDDNNHTVKCENCSFTWTVPHNKVTVSAKPATCTEAGYSAGTYCADGCGYDTRTFSTAEGHKLETITGKAATCTEDGLTDGKKCSVCQEIIVPQEKIAAGHKWGDWTVTAATCTKDGKKTRSCSVCKETETETIPAEGHKSEPIPDKEATCTEPGSVGGKRCSVCQAVLEEPKVIPATGHDWGLWADTKDGWRHVRFCANDPTHKQYDFHKMGNWITVKYNTQTTDGYRERWCQAEDCDYHEIQVIKAGAPQTGDSGNILLYSGLCLISVCGVAGLSVFAKRRKEQ